MPQAMNGQDDLERVLRPIVEGQLRSFGNDHPQLIKAVDWFKPRTDRLTTFVNSGAKRILSDLLCTETRVRLIAALGGTTTAEDATSGGVTASAAANGPVIPSGAGMGVTPNAQAADLESSAGSAALPTGEPEQ